jgi:hypothetical protein
MVGGQDGAGQDAACRLPGGSVFDRRGVLAEESGVLLRQYASNAAAGSRAAVGLTSWLTSPDAETLTHPDAALDPYPAVYGSTLVATRILDPNDSS